MLFVSPQPTPDMSGLPVRVRLSIWRRVILAGEAPTPYGIILSARNLKADAKGARKRALVFTSLDALHSDAAALSIKLGGQRVLNFFR